MLFTAGCRLLLPPFSRHLTCLKTAGHPICVEASAAPVPHSLPVGHVLYTSVFLSFTSSLSLVYFSRQSHCHLCSAYNPPAPTFLFFLFLCICCPNSSFYALLVQLRIYGAWHLSLLNQGLFFQTISPTCQNHFEFKSCAPTRLWFLPAGVIPGFSEQAPLSCQSC